MIRAELHPSFKDERGTIRDLLTEVTLDSVTLIRTLSGGVRGNHYHAETTQWTYVMRGKLKVVTSDGPGSPTREAEIAHAGDLFISPPGEAHAWQALEDTDVLVFTRGPRSGQNYESDTTRLEESQRLIG